MGNDDFKKLGGLWISEKKEGRTQHMSGSLRGEDIENIISCARDGDGSVRIFVHKNDRKREGKRDLDYAMSCVANKPKEAAKQAQAKSDNPINDSDVPF